MSGRPMILLLVVALAGCRVHDVQPADLRVGEEACGTCRMVISDQRFGSQIVAPHEDPRFFDDLGCLSNYLRSHPLASGAHVYVADHRTRAWVPAERAVFTTAAAARAPMGSSVIAHESTASRDLDPEARDGAAVDPAAILQAKGGR